MMLLLAGGAQSGALPAMRQYQTVDRVLTAGTRGDFPDPAAAYNYARDNWDLGGKNLKIQIVGNIDTSTGWLINGRIPGAVDAASVLIEGDRNTPASHTLSSSVSGVPLFWFRGGAVASIYGLTMRTNSGYGILVGNGEVWYGNNRFGAAHVHVDAAGNTSQVWQLAPCDVLAEPFYSHAIIESGALAWLLSRVNLIGAVSWSNAFVQVDIGSTIDTAGAFSYTGSGTGRRFNVIDNSRIHVAGGGPNVFPGDSAGYVHPLGWYG